MPTAGVAGFPELYTYRYLPCHTDDVDHPGVGNQQMSIEHPMIGERYRNKSVTEQNSLDVAWDVLMVRNLVCYCSNRVEILSRCQALTDNLIRTAGLTFP